MSEIVRKFATSQGAVTATWRNPEYGWHFEPPCPAGEMPGWAAGPPTRYGDWAPPGIRMVCRDDDGWFSEFMPEAAA